MPSDGDPRQIRKRIFICACVPAIDLFDDILIHRKRLIYEWRMNRKQQRLSPGRGPAACSAPLRSAPRGGQETYPGPHSPPPLPGFRGQKVGEVGSKSVEKDRDFLITSNPLLLRAGFLNQPTPHTCCLHSAFSHGK